MKIRGYELNNNSGNAFWVEDSVLKVSYDQYDISVSDMAISFTKRNYKVALEYRFIGNQATGGEDWATRNSGIMNLKGCMDANAINYKSYYVKADNTLCEYR